MRINRTDLTRIVRDSLDAAHAPHESAQKIMQFVKTTDRVVYGTFERRDVDGQVCYCPLTGPDLRSHGVEFSPWERDFYQVYDAKMGRFVIAQGLHVVNDDFYQIVYVHDVEDGIRD